MCYLITSLTWSRAAKLTGSLLKQSLRKCNCGFGLCRPFTNLLYKQTLLNALSNRRFQRGFLNITQSNPHRSVWKRSGCEDFSSKCCSTIHICECVLLVADRLLSTASLTHLTLGFGKWSIVITNRNVHGCHCVLIKIWLLLQTGITCYLLELDLFFNCYNHQWHFV